MFEGTRAEGARAEGARVGFFCMCMRDAGVHVLGGELLHQSANLLLCPPRKVVKAARTPTVQGGAAGKVQLDSAHHCSLQAVKPSVRRGRGELRAGTPPHFRAACAMERASTIIIIFL